MKGMVKKFPSLAALVEQLFDMKDAMGKLQATGYLVSVLVRCFASFVGP